MSAKKAGVVDIELTSAEPAGNPGHCSAVVQVSLADGRQFSILAATPSWFDEIFVRLGLNYYYGPAVLFVRSMELGIVRRAVGEMAEAGDLWLCRHDTPRTTLAKVLGDFQTKHPDVI